MRKCGYCGSSGTLTREHLLPVSAGKTLACFDYKPFQFLLRLEDYVETEVKIKDVCAECNNVTLGSLDEWASNSFLCQLTQNFEEGEERAIDYSYDKLLRWFLKLGFNAARINGTAPERFEPHRQFILRGTHAPKRNTIFFVALSPYFFTPEESILASQKGLEDTNVLYPRFFRISQMFLQCRESEKFAVRAFSFNSLMAIMVVGTSKTSHREFVAVQSEIRKRLPHVKALHQNRSTVSIKASPLTILDTFGPQTQLFPPKNKHPSELG